MMPNYERPAFNPDVTRQLLKPPKGEFLLERKDKRKEIEAGEDEQKAIVRFRDGRCRWPHCEVCRRYKTLVLQVSHVVRAKGMSGDRTLERSQADQMMLLDPITHAAQERHEKDVVPLTDEGTKGPCEFWAEDEHGQKYLVAREIAPFIYERD